MHALDRSPAIEMTPDEVLLLVEERGSGLLATAVDVDSSVLRHRAQIDVIDYLLLIETFSHDNWPPEEIATLRAQRLEHTAAIGERKAQLGRPACDPEQELKKFAGLVAMARERGINEKAVIGFWQEIIGDAVIQQMEIIERAA